MGSRGFMEEFMISMDDTPGALASVTGAIAEAGANILAVSAIARQCATACIITDDADATRAALDGLGTDYSARQVHKASLPHEAGSLAAFAGSLAAEGTNIRSLQVLGVDGENAVVGYTTD